MKFLYYSFPESPFADGPCSKGKDSPNFYSCYYQMNSRDSLRSCARIRHNLKMKENMNLGLEWLKYLIMEKEDFFCFYRNWFLLNGYIYLKPNFLFSYCFLQSSLIFLLKYLNYWILNSLNLQLFQHFQCWVSILFIWKSFSSWYADSWYRTFY